DKKLVIRTTYSVLSVFWGIALAGIAVTVFSVLMEIFVEIPSTLDVPAQIELKDSNLINKAAEKISSEPFHVSSLYLTTVYLTKPSSLQKIFSSVYNLLWIVSIFYSIHLIRRVLKTIYKDNEFAESNIRDIKNLAKIVLFAPFILSVIKYLYVLPATDFSFTGRQIGFENFTITLRNSFGYDFIIYAVFGGLIYIIAAAFEYGRTLKQENDLTV
ncbi:MAG: DUF2975 domain-containing protein, partial [Bacteroidota bacterium]